MSKYAVPNATGKLAIRLVDSVTKLYLLVHLVIAVLLDSQSGARTLLRI
jgi:hypothetical protein